MQRYRAKEEVVHKLGRIRSSTVTPLMYHGYTPAILKRRTKKAMVKKLLKGRKVKFHTPFSDCTCQFQSTMEVAEDRGKGIKTSQGCSVTIVSATASLDKPDFYLHWWLLVAVMPQVFTKGEEKLLHSMKKNSNSDRGVHNQQQSLVTCREVWSLFSTSGSYLIAL